MEAQSRKETAGCILPAVVTQAEVSWSPRGGWRHVTLAWMVAAPPEARLAEQTNEPGSGGFSFPGTRVTLGKSCLLCLSFPIGSRELGVESEFSDLNIPLPALKS